MKPLRTDHKNWLYQRLVFGKARRVVAPLYDVLIEALVRAHRWEDSLHPRDRSDLSDLTAIIKTFQRPYALGRLVASIQRLYPSLRIIVVDDSGKTTRLPGVITLEMPFDSGISAGRNRALEVVETPYFVLLDDDFLFSRRQNLGRQVDFLRRHPEVDIVGGRYVDLPLYIEHDFEQQGLHSTLAQPKIPLGTKIEDCIVVDKVQNYFVGRTETVREVGWDPALKLMEHTEFFTRARSRLVTVFHPQMKILHVKYPFDWGYLAYRWRSPADFSPTEF